MEGPGRRYPGGVPHAHNVRMPVEKVTGRPVHHAQAGLIYDGLKAAGNAAAASVRAAGGAVGTATGITARAAVAPEALLLGGSGTIKTSSGSPAVPAETVRRFSPLNKYMAAARLIVVIVVSLAMLHVYVGENNNTWGSVAATSSITMRYLIAYSLWTAGCNVGAGTCSTTFPTNMQGPPINGNLVLWGVFGTVVGVLLTRVFYGWKNHTYARVKRNAAYFDDPLVEFRNIVQNTLFGILVAFFGGLHYTQSAMLITVCVMYMEKNYAERLKHFMTAVDGAATQSTDAEVVWKRRMHGARGIFYDIVPLAIFVGVFLVCGIQSSWPTQDYAMMKALYVYAAFYLLRSPYIALIVSAALGEYFGWVHSTKLDLVIGWYELLADVMVFVMFGLITASVTVVGGYAA